MCVCVCVCVCERERERKTLIFYKNKLLFFFEVLKNILNTFKFEDVCPMIFTLEHISVIFLHLICNHGNLLQKASFMQGQRVVRKYCISISQGNVTDMHESYI